MLPVENEHLLHIGMQTQMYRAGLCTVFKGFLLSVSVFAVRHIKDNFDLANATGISIHNLGDGDFRARHVHVVLPGIDADNGHGAGCQSRGAEVGGRKGFDGF